MAASVSHRCDASGNLLPTSYAYDANGQVVSSTDPAGNVTSQTTNKLGEVTQSATTPANSSTPDPSSVQNVTYDAVGQRLTLGNSSGTTTYSYTPRGQVAGQQVQDGSGTTLTSSAYTFDVNGNQTQQTLTLGANGPQTATSYGYDALNRVITMSDRARTFGYDPIGNATQMIVDTPGTTTLADEMDLTWDGVSRNASVSDYVGPNKAQYDVYQYLYDQANNVTSVETNGSYMTYAYNDANELTDVKQGTGSTATEVTKYTYDANHNRQSMTCYTCGSTSGLTTQYFYQSANPNVLDHLTDYSGHTTAFTYDPKTGNLTQRTYDPNLSDQQVTSYSYTTNGRLASVTLPDGTVVSYSYDSNQQRTSTVVTPGTGASETASTTSDTYQQGLLATESNASGTLLATFTYDSNGTPVSVLVGSDPTTAPRYYYLFDGHGNVVALTDANGNAIASYSYDEFGQVQTNTEHFSNGWHNPYLYNGAFRVRYDATTGLDWMSVRAYDPSLGRFISRDPLSRSPLFGLATQPYVFANNNPLTNVDPSGQLHTALNGTMQESAPPQQKGRGAPASATKTATVAMHITTTAVHTTTGHNSQATSTSSNGCTDVKGEPTCAQIATARGIANDFAAESNDRFDWLTKASLVSGFLGGLLSKVEGIPFIGDKIKDLLEDQGLKALTKLVAAFSVELLVLAATFSWQASWGDGAWRSKAAWVAFDGLILVELAGFSTAITDAMTAVAQVMFGGPEDPAADFASLIASAIGVTANVLFAGVGAYQALEAEREALW